MSTFWIVVAVAATFAASFTAVFALLWPFERKTLPTRHGVL
jgi:hypothetical protein